VNTKRPFLGERGGGGGGPLRKIKKKKERKKGVNHVNLVSFIFGIWEGRKKGKDQSLPFGIAHSDSGEGKGGLTRRWYPICCFRKRKKGGKKGGRGVVTVRDRTHVLPYRRRGGKGKKKKSFHAE